MKKGRLFTTSMATVILVATLSSPVAGAKTHEEIKNFYQNSSEYPASIPTANKTGSTIQTETSQNKVNTNYNLKQLEAKLANSSSVYDYSSVLNQTGMIQQAIANQQSTYTDSFVSNVDSIRRSALEKVFGISLTDVDIWNNSEGLTSLIGSPYTSVKELKDSAIYSINANRQELIKYGEKNNNWQPYRWFSALNNPSHFEIVNGKLEYNKNYYAYISDTVLRSLLWDYQFEGNATKQDELKKIFEKKLQEVTSAYNNAPGYAVHSYMLHQYTPMNNSNFSAIPYDKGFFDSKWNNPKVLQGGTLDGTNPYKDIIKGLHDGTLIGNITDGYKIPTESETKSSDKEETKKNENTNTQVNESLNKVTANVAMKTDDSVEKDNITLVVEEVEKEDEKQPSLFDRIILKVKKVASLD